MFCILLKKMNHLTKRSSANKTETNIVCIRRNTAWFESEEKKKDDEVMWRQMIWSDFSKWGYINFRVCKKQLYNNLFEYLKLGKKPPAFTGWLPLEFELGTKKDFTEWIWPEGKIICYHKWCIYAEEGRIEFRINNMNLFEKFIVYVVKFKA